MSGKQLHHNYRKYSTYLSLIYNYRRHQSSCPLVAAAGEGLRDLASSLGDRPPSSSSSAVAGLGEGERDRCCCSIGSCWSAGEWLRGDRERRGLLAGESRDLSIELSASLLLLRDLERDRLREWFRAAGDALLERLRDLLRLRPLDRERDRSRDLERLLVLLRRSRERDLERLRKKLGDKEAV